MNLKCKRIRQLCHDDLDKKAIQGKSIRENSDRKPTPGLQCPGHADNAAN